MDDIHEYDEVALLVDIPDSGLRRGDTGAVAHMFDKTDDHPGGFIVEFVDESGSTRALIDIVDPSLVEVTVRPPAPEAE